MAINNRTEAQNAATAALIPTLTLAQHLNLLNNSVLNSTLFEKDIIGSETPGGGAVTINYGNKDTATVTTATDLAVSFTNLENGAIKHLVITKQATNVISFVGAVDNVRNKLYLHTIATSVCYRVSNKNGVVYVEAISIGVNSSFAAATVNGDFSGTVKYRYNYQTDLIELEINVTCVTPGNGKIFSTLPALIWPDRTIEFPLMKTASAGSETSSVNAGYIETDGELRITSTVSVATGEKFTAFIMYYKSLP